MSLPKLNQQPDPEPLRRALEHYPGGRYIRPHQEDGPYGIVLVIQCARPSPIAKAVLTAYPARCEIPAPHWGDTVNATVHVMPEFPMQVLRWEARDYELELYEETEFVLEWAPTDRDIAAAFGAVLLDGTADGEVTDVLEDAVDHIGLDGLVKLLRELPDAVRFDREPLIAAIAGICATTT